MTLTRILTVIFAVTVAGGAHAADPGASDPYPEQCRIWSCRIASPSTTASLAPDIDTISIRVGSQDVPVTEQTIFAPSTDGQQYACIGYGAFGDPEVKCLLVP